MVDYLKILFSVNIKACRFDHYYILIAKSNWLQNLVFYQAEKQQQYNVFKHQ
jgi:hypothetical protein